MNKDLYPYKIYLLLIFFSFDCYGISLVYNMKIRRIFNIGTDIKEDLPDNHSSSLSENIELNSSLENIEKERLLKIAKKKNTWSLTFVPIAYRRQRHIVDENINVDVFDKSLIAGLLFNVRYTRSKTWWIEASTGYEKERVEVCGTDNFTNSERGFDDLVFAYGRNFFPSENSQFTVYAINGIPTTKIVNAKEKFDTLVGTRFYSIGAGYELSYAFVNNKKNSFVGIFQNRLVHFFQRKFYPVLPCNAFLEPGNVTDMLFTLQYRLKRNILEVGYNKTFFTNYGVNRHLTRISGPTFSRNSFYTTISHACKRFPIIKTPVVVSTGCYMSRAKRFDIKILSVFFNLTTVL